MFTRRVFLGGLGAALVGAGASTASALGAQTPTPAGPQTRRAGAPQSHEFVFARLRYNSGDWDYNSKVAANVLDAIVQYTTIPVYPEEIVITPDSEELLSFPFVFMTGHTLVRFNAAERQNLVDFVDNGGLLFSDDCNHDINGLYAKSFEAEMRRAFPGPKTLEKIPNTHPIFRSFFKFPDGPPQTSHALNGWGDDIVHEYVRGIVARGGRGGDVQRDRLGVLYSNKDYGCEWDYDWRNKRFRTEDNTKFAVNVAVYVMT